MKYALAINGSPRKGGNTEFLLKALIERAGYVAYANGHAFSEKIGAAVVAVRRGRPGKYASS